MFLCEKCHGSCDCGAGLIFRSRGRCETCKEDASCVECFAHHRPKANTKRSNKDSTFGVRSPAERSETRIFRFADDAWEVPKGQTVCRVDVAPVVLTAMHQRIATLADEARRTAMVRASRSFSVPDSCVRENGCRRENGYVVWPDGEKYPDGPMVCLLSVRGYYAFPSLVGGDAPLARRVSTWAEWFDLTLTNAAHAYLAARIAAHRKYLDSGCERAPAPQMAALDDMLSAFTYAEKELVSVTAFGSIQPHHFTSPGHRREYLARVKADIEARLSGEPGTVVQP